MLKFPPELCVHRGTVLSLLSVVGGLVLTLTAGGRCADMAVMTAQDPVKLLCLSNALLRLMGLEGARRVKKSGTKQKRRLYFTDSLSSLLHVAEHVCVDLMSLVCVPCANPVSVKRSKIFYILIYAARGRAVLTLNLGRELRTYCPSDPLHWLVTFSRQAREQGNMVLLLARRESNKELKRNDQASSKQQPTHLNVGVCALFVVLLWIFLPHISVCVVVVFIWKLQQQHVTQ